LAKKRSEFVCNSCGAVTPKWAGKCPECESWNSLEEVLVEKSSGSIGAQGGTLQKYEPTAKPVLMKDIKGLEVDRFKTGIGELDQVLGGGFVKGSVVLIGGEPGIGKSTIMMQASGILGGAGKNILYVSGEESPSQLKMRADRLGTDNKKTNILSTGALEDILAAMDEERYDYIIVDSVQTVSSKELTGAPGTVGQIKHVTYRLVETAKSRGITVIVVGQVTKDGNIAGPKVLEHLVDTVLYFEGDYNRGVRILRSVKNRFGATDEVGIFEMSEKGLIPKGDVALFEENDTGAGRVVCPVMEGTRAFLVEIQALVTPTFYQFSRRNSMGFDTNRLNMLLAVLGKKAGLNLGGSDVYLNVAGGMKINGTGADLAVCAAVISSFREKPLQKDATFIGEVGLSGEIRNVSQIKSRVTEATKFGINKFYMPVKADVDGFDFITVKNIADFIDLI